MNNFLFVLVLLITPHLILSQQEFKTLAGRDYRFYCFTQNNYRIDKIDTFLIITDDYNKDGFAHSSMMFSLKNFNFIKRTDPLVNVNSEDGYKYLGFSKNNGGEFWYISKSIRDSSGYFEKYSVKRKNNDPTRSYITFKSDSFEVDNDNLLGCILVGDTIYIQSRNKLFPNDVQYYVTSWNIINEKQIETSNDYILPNGNLPLKCFSNNCFLADKDRIYNAKTEKSLNLYYSIRKEFPDIIPNTYAAERNINYLEKSKAIIAFYESVSVLNDSSSLTKFATFVIDSNLNITDKIFSNTIIRNDSYNDKLNSLYYIDDKYRLVTYNVNENKIISSINLSDYLGNKNVEDIHNVTFIDDSTLLFTLKNIKKFNGIHSSFFYDIKNNMIGRNIYNNLYYIQNTSISSDDKYIAVIGKNRVLNIYDSTFKELATFNWLNDNCLNYYDTTRMYSELNFNPYNNKILVTSSNLMSYNSVIELNNFKIEHIFEEVDSSFTSAWNSNGKYLAMNNKMNQVKLFNTSGNYQLIRKLDLPANYQIVRIMFLSDDTLCILTKDLLTKNDIIVYWNCPTYDYTEYKLNMNLFKVNTFNRENCNIKASKDNKNFYQDYEGKFVYINVQTLNMEITTLTDRVVDYIPQYNFAMLSNDNKNILYSESHREKPNNSNPQLSVYNFSKKSKKTNLSNLIFINDFCEYKYDDEKYLTTRQFCNYAQFNKNPNKIVCGSFDGTLSILEFDNLLTSVETENINSLDNTSKVFVNGETFEFRNNEQYPVKLSVYNFNGITVSEIVLETSEQIDLVKYSNNEKMLLIQRENNLTGEVLDNKILIFQ